MQHAKFEARAVQKLESQAKNIRPPPTETPAEKTVQTLETQTENVNTYQDVKKCQLL